MVGTTFIHAVWYDFGHISCNINADKLFTGRKFTIGVSNMREMWSVSLIDFLIEQQRGLKGHDGPGTY